MTLSTLRTAFLGLTAGAVATFAKTKAEEVLQPRAEKALPPSPAAKTAIGGDAAGHPENMPPSELADRVQHAVTGEQLSDEQRQKVSAPLHWAMGVGSGMVYAFAADAFPAVRLGRGAAAGVALFAATHASALPAAGLQHPPSKMPVAWWGWEAGSHVVYGVVLDTSFNLARRLATR